MASSKPASRRWCLGTMSGEKEPSRSRGTPTVTGPTSVWTVLSVVPFLEFPEPRPSASWGSSPLLGAGGAAVRPGPARARPGPPQPRSRAVAGLRCSWWLWAWLILSGHDLTVADPLDHA